MRTTDLGKHYIYYPLTFLLSYILVFCTWSRRATLTGMQHAASIWFRLAALLPLLIGSEPYVQHAESL